MKRIFVCAALFLSLSAVAIAEDARPIEIFGGYSYAQFNGANPGENLDIHLHGWNASLTININNWAGFVSDFGGVYRSVPEYRQQFKIHSILFGPKFTARTGRVSPFAQILFGPANLNVIDLRTDQEDYSSSDFSMSVGGGLDVRINDFIAVRPAQVEYWGIRDGESGNFTYNFRYSGGIVFRVTLDQF
ncbi:MAG: outer membrane beta-barrel protein [Acidobacteriota bacterium]|jgi:opacity protein-like surface antigen